MVAPRKGGGKTGDDDSPDRGSVRWLLGRPEPSLAYLDEMISRLWSYTCPAIVVILVLYFLFGS